MFAYSFYWFIDLILKYTSWKTFFSLLLSKNFKEYDEVIKEYDCKIKAILFFF